MHTYIKYGTINDVMYKIGTFVTPAELGRTAKHMIDDDLRVKGLENVRGFEPNPEALALLKGYDSDGDGLMLSHWQKVENSG